MTNNFGHYIERGRAAKRINKSELARRTEITPQYVTDIEKGHTVPSEDVIERLINVLELDERTAFQLADKLPSRVIERVKREYYGGGRA